MSDTLYSTFEPDPAVVMVSGQEIDPSGGEVSGLQETAAIWTLSNSNGQTPVDSTKVGAVRLAIPLGPTAAALYQNTSYYHLNLPTAAKTVAEQSGEYAITVFNKRSDFSNAGLNQPSIAINSDFCAFSIGTISQCTDTICEQARTSGPPCLIVTVTAQTDGVLPISDMANLEIEFVDAIVSNIPASTSVYLLTFDYENGEYSDCPSSITALPITKLPRIPGVSNFHAEPQTQFVAGSDAPTQVTLMWDFSDGGLTRIAPHAILTIGQQGAAASQITLDESALRGGSYVVETPAVGQNFMSLDYVIAGTAGAGGIGGILYENFSIIAEQTNLRNPNFSGNASMFGTLQDNLALGSYTPSGDGYILCQFKATGAPTNTGGLSSYAQVSQSGRDAGPAVRLQMTASAAATLSASATFTQSELVPITAGAEVTLVFQDSENPPLSECTFTWLPIGDATLSQA